MLHTHIPGPQFHANPPLPSIHLLAWGQGYSKQLTSTVQLYLQSMPFTRHNVGFKLINALNGSAINSNNRIVGLQASLSCGRSFKDLAQAYRFLNWHAHRMDKGNKHNGKKQIETGTRCNDGNTSPY